MGFWNVHQSSIWGFAAFSDIEIFQSSETSNNLFEPFMCLTVFPCAWKAPNKMWHPACTKHLTAYCMDMKRNNLRPAHWSGSKLGDRSAIFVISWGPLGLVSGPLLIRDIFSLIDQLLGHRKQWITNEAGNLICHGKKSMRAFLPCY